MWKLNYINAIYWKMVCKRTLLKWKDHSTEIRGKDRDVDWIEWTVLLLCSCTIYIDIYIYMYIVYDSISSTLARRAWKLWRRYRNCRALHQQSNTLAARHCFRHYYGVLRDRCTYRECQRRYGSQAGEKGSGYWRRRVCAVYMNQWRQYYHSRLNNKYALLVAAHHWVAGSVRSAVRVWRSHTSGGPSSCAPNTIH